MNFGMQRRSLLFVPGHSLKMMGKACASEADAIILDLEDSVGEQEKEGARGNVVAEMQRMKDSGKEIFVRVNAANTFVGVWDLLGIVGCTSPDALVIPKAERNAIITADTVLEGCERNLGIAKGTIGLIPQIETVAGLVGIRETLAASERIVGVFFGAEDLTRDIGIPRTKSGEEIIYARNVVAYAAHSRGVGALDTPFTDVNDLEGLERDTLTAKAMGFTGKTCIHPKHVPIINQCFSASEAEMREAREILSAYRQALLEGKGACNYNGKMVDKPIAVRAAQLLQETL